MPDSLYFIAQLPPEETVTKVRKLQDLLSRRFGYRKALRKPVHTTLIKPFRRAEDGITVLKKLLETVAAGAESFPAASSEIGSFGKRVLYLAMSPKSSFAHLHRTIKDKLMTNLHFPPDFFESRPFVPHITLASRDVKKASFEQAFNLLQEQRVELSYRCDRFHLMKHNGTQWQTDSEFTLIE